MIKTLLFLICLPLAAQDYCSPYALAVTGDARTLYAGCATAPRIEVVDIAAKRVSRTIATPNPISGLVLSSDGVTMYATCPLPTSKLLLIDTASGKIRRTITTGHTSEAPLLTPDGNRLYVPNKFSDDVSVIDLGAGKEIVKLKAIREPIGAALSKDGRTLFVINSVPYGRADADHVAAAISVYDTTSFQSAGTIQLPNGSAEPRAIDVSPDGQYAAVTHVLARFYLPTTQLDRGWMETNAVSVIDLARREVVATLLLDAPDRGAANPWSVKINGRQLVVTHAGTHEVSIIDTAALETRIRKLAPKPGVIPGSDDLSLLAGIRTRTPLIGNGPRGLAVAGGKAFVPGYFSETIEQVDLAAGKSSVLVRLGAAPITIQRRGEMLFNDGSLCFQGWQSCASCHSPDARVDALNWDLMNDGLGNPKNVKSLLLTHRTPPAMSHGVRGNAELAVRAGIRYILFTERPEEEAVALDEFLKSLKPVPSPHLVNSKLSPSAQRGKKTFFDSKVGCAKCHPQGLYTDMQTYDVGTRMETDSSSDFDTPTLVEIWRTAPYLHNGSAADLTDVLTKSNLQDKHGKTSHLRESQIHDLVEFLLSL